MGIITEPSSVGYCEDEICLIYYKALGAWHAIKVLNKDYLRFSTLFHTILFATDFVSAIRLQTVRVGTVLYLVNSPHHAYYSQICRNHLLGT